MLFNNVSLQRSGGTLQEAQARSLLIGVGPQVPAPQMAGLETKVTASINSSWTHNPGVCLLTRVVQAENLLAVSTCHPTCILLHTEYSVANLFPSSPHPSMHAFSLHCAHNHVKLARDAMCSAIIQGNIQAQQPESSFPAMQPADAVRYQSMFQQMDSDRDGYVQASCFVTGQLA